MAIHNIPLLTQLQPRHHHLIHSIMCRPILLQLLLIHSLITQPIYRLQPRHPKSIRIMGRSRSTLQQRHLNNYLNLLILRVRVTMPYLFPQHRSGFHPSRIRCRQFHHHLNSHNNTKMDQCFGLPTHRSTPTPTAYRVEHRTHILQRHSNHSHIKILLTPILPQTRDMQCNRR